MADAGREYVDDGSQMPVCHMEGCIALERLRTEMSTGFVRLDGIATANAKGVNNFRVFQEDAKAKLAFIHGAAWAWSVILVLLLSVFGYALHVVAPMFKEALIDYYTRHPGARLEHKSFSGQPGEVYTVRNSSPLDAAIPRNP